MAKYFSCCLVLVFLSQVLSAPLTEYDRYGEIHQAKDPQADTPLARTIRQAGQGSQQTVKQSNKSGTKTKTNGKASAATQIAQLPTEARSETNQQEQESTLSQVDLRNARTQELNENADMMPRSSSDLQPQESQQEPRTHGLLNHPLFDKLKGLKGGYGYDSGYSLGGDDYGSYSYQHEPIIQPVIHQKPVLFHQEVIKPIVHEIVKPLPVYHETVKPIVHEVVKTLPVVKEIVKPVPVVHEILKPYSVPVVHPVQFHHQATKINIPMQYKCELVPGPGGPAIGGLQKGYGSYGSYGSGFSGGLSGGSISLGGGYGVGGGIGLSGAHGLGGTGLGSYSLPIQTLPPKYIGGHGHGLFKSNTQARDSMQDDIADMIQSEELNYSSMDPSEMSMKSMSQRNPQQFAKLVHNMNQKEANLRNNMRSNILDFQQKLFQEMTPNNQQFLPIEQNQRTKMTMDKLPQGMRSAEIGMEQIPLEQMGSAEIPWMQRSAQMEMPIAPSVMQSAEINVQQSPLDQVNMPFERNIPPLWMKSAEMPPQMNVPIGRSVLPPWWGTQRSAEMNIQQSPLEKLRYSQMDIPMERSILPPWMRSAELNMQQPSFAPKRPSEMDLSMGRSILQPYMRSAEMDIQQSPLEQMRFPQMGIPIESRSMQIPAWGQMRTAQNMQQMPMEQLRSAQMEQAPLEQYRSAEMNAQESERS